MFLYDDLRIGYEDVKLAHLEDFNCLLCNFKLPAYNDMICFYASRT